MNRYHVTSLGLFAVAAAGVVIAVRDIQRTVNEGVAARRKIRDEGKAEIERMQYATMKVCQEIREGRYDRSGLEGIHQSFKFYRQVSDPKE